MGISHSFPAQAADGDDGDGRAIAVHVRFPGVLPVAAAEALLLPGYTGAVRRRRSGGAMRARPLAARGSRAGGAASPSRTTSARLLRWRGATASAASSSRRTRRRPSTTSRRSRAAPCPSRPSPSTEARCVRNAASLARARGDASPALAQVGGRENATLGLDFAEAQGHFIERRTADAPDARLAAASFLADLDLLASADFFVGTWEATLSRLAVLAIAARTGALPPFIFLDAPNNRRAWGPRRGRVGAPPE